MKTWISLLRGVNVGGKNILPMKELRSLLNELGYENVQTYIQSGNCVFESNKTSSSAISKHVAQGIADKFGFKPSVITLSVAELRSAIKKNPYDVENEEPRSIHFFFLSEEPKVADKEALQGLKHPSEEFMLTKSVFYLFAPEGIARSKLVARAEAKIGVPTTARNYRTVAKLADLATQV